MRKTFRCDLSTKWQLGQRKRMHMMSLILSMIEYYSGKQFDNSNGHDYSIIIEAVVERQTYRLGIL